MQCVYVTSSNVAIFTYVKYFHMKIYTLLNIYSGKPGLASCYLLAFLTRCFDGKLYGLGASRNTLGFIFICISYDC